VSKNLFFTIPWKVSKAEVSVVNGVKSED